jgi:hypothetical protein
MRENGIKKQVGLKDPTVYNKNLVNNALLMKAALEVIAEDECIDCSAIEDADQLRMPDGTIIDPLICGKVSGNPNDKFCPACTARDVLGRLH